MGVYNKAIDILNTNVYGTNLLLIPGLVCAIFILTNIDKWRYNKEYNIDQKKVYYYRYIWVILIVIFILTIFFSTVYHFSMFGNNNILMKIGQIDYKISAPLLTIILIALHTFYIIFLNTTCENENNDGHKYENLYILTLITSSFGAIIFVVKRFLFSGYSRRTFLHKIKYLTGHTFFHYIAYTGISFLMILYYIENKNIYDTFFTDKCTKKSIKDNIIKNI